MNNEDKKALYEKDPRQLLLWYMIERENIRMNRAAGYMKPWTADPFLQRFRFCNVHRIHDVVTMHYMEWIKPLFYEGSLTKTNNPGLVVFNTILYRLFNQPAAMDRIGLQTNFTKAGLIDACVKAKADGIQLFNAAYMITNSFSTGPKHELIADSMLPAWQEQEKLGAEVVQHGTIKFVSTRVCDYFMVGPFLGYEVGTDLSYNLLSNAPDINEWANLGPGAKRGLNRIRREKLEKSINNTSAILLMKQLRKELNEKWPAGPVLTLRDVEHSLCEFDKYCRCITGVGKPKARYNGIR